MVKSISATEFLKLGTDSVEFINFDVRSAEEIAATSLLTEENSVNIPLPEIGAAMSKSERAFKADYGEEKPSVDSKIVVSCLSGGRSMMAAT